MKKIDLVNVLHLSLMLTTVLGLISTILCKITHTPIETTFVDCFCSNLALFFSALTMHSYYSNYKSFKRLWQEITGLLESEEE